MMALIDDQQVEVSEVEEGETFVQQVKKHLVDHDKDLVFIDRPLPVIVCPVVDVIRAT